MSAPEWTPRGPTGVSEIDTWHLYLDGIAVYGYVSLYTLDSTYCNWQAVRGEFRLGGSAPTVEAGWAMAEQMLALPVDEFNALVATALVADLHELERKILTLQPDAALLPGYHSGYEDGVADTKHKIEEYLA